MSTTVESDPPSSLFEEVPSRLPRQRREPRADSGSAQLPDRIRTKVDDSPAVEVLGPGHIKLTRPSYPSGSKGFNDLCLALKALRGQREITIDVASVTDGPSHLARELVSPWANHDKNHPVTLTILNVRSALHSTFQLFGFDTLKDKGLVIEPV